MKLTQSAEANINYLAAVIRVNKILPHPNADRIEILDVFSNNIIVQKGQYKIGDLAVYFPVESAINLEFLAYHNLLDNPDLNKDQKTKGFFGKKGRVRALSMRSVPSQGFVLPVDKVAEFYGASIDIFKEGEEFDSIDDKILLKKYVPGIVSQQNAPKEKKIKIPSWIDKTIGLFPRSIRTVLYSRVNAYYKSKEPAGIKSLIVPGQFEFHYDTPQLGRNAFILKPSDVITIGVKMHGTSAIICNLLCGKQLSFKDKLAYKLGVNIRRKEYKHIYSSRSVIKNTRSGEYTSDVWGKHAEELNGKIPAGISLYGEIVGWSGNDKCIQKNYDYGVARGESEFRVYRITHTSDKGNVLEFDWTMIQDFCDEYGLETVPVYYHGIARDLFDLDPEDPEWSSNFVNELKTTYLEKDCEFCVNKVPSEGIVVKINNRKAKPVFKLKSSAFLQKESKDRDENPDQEELN